jgi:uncharacterized repeat protein (TIGR01451 family)
MIAKMTGMTTKLIGLLACLLFFFASVSFSQSLITLRETYKGRFNILSTGGTLRSQPNGTNACSINTTSTAALSGLPSTATVTKAYLYWSGSGQTADNNVTFDGTAYSADRTFSTIFPLGTNNFHFFSGVKDVTSKIQARRNASYTFTDLTFQTADSTAQPYCSQQAVLGGWALYVIYNDSAESPKRVALHEGFENFRNSSRTFTLSGMYAPPAPQGKMSILTWEGDPTLSGTEGFRFNGNTLIDAINPLNNVFNSTINVINNSATHGVDVDTFEVGSYINANDRTATAIINSGPDLVLLNAVLLSASTNVADLELSKTVNNATPVEGQGITYSLNLFNRGINTGTGIQVKDVLPAGITFVSATTTNGTYNPTTGIWDIAALNVNDTATLTINAVVDVGRAGTAITNTSEVILSDNFDPDSPENNGVTTEDDYSAVTVNVKPNADLAIVKTGPANINFGQTINYAIEVANNGPTNVNGMSIADVVPAGVTVTSWNCTATGTATCGTASGTTNNINLTGNINAGAANKLTINITGTVNSTNPIANTATVTIPNSYHDANLLNNTSTVNTTVNLTISGTVWQDSDGSANGTFTGIQNGTETGTNAGGLFAIAVNSAGNVVSSVAVNTNGTYTIGGIPINTANLSIRLATTTAANGLPAPTANVPAGWANTSPLATAAFNSVTTNIGGRDFGIEQLPTANGLTATAQPNPSANVSVFIPSNIFTATDPDGTAASYRITAFPTNITSITIGGTNYTSATFPVGGVSITAVTGSIPLGTISVDPIDGVVTVAIIFNVTDNAGKTSSATSTANIPFGASLPPDVSLVKSCTFPANCATAAQLPGTDLTYQIAFTNTGGQAAQGLVILDAIPVNTDFKIGSTTQTVPAGLTLIVEYSFDYTTISPATATWTATPPATGGGGASAGYNRLLKAIRWRSSAGSLTHVAPNNTGNVVFVVKIQ